MYKVAYQKVKIMEDGTHAKMSFSKDTAYLDCEFEEIQRVLEKYLLKTNQKMYPLINSAVWIKGHIVI